MAAEPVVVLAGTLDTKGHELEYMCARVQEAGAARRRDDGWSHRTPAVTRTREPLEELGYPRLPSRSASS
jgi:uncharacterized protein (UPF0261 family)